MSTSSPTLWLDDKRGYLTDWVTQRWVQLTGKILDLKHAEWLRGHIGETKEIGESYFDNLATRDCLTLNANPDDDGLIEDFSQLRSDSFSPTQVHPAIKDFYEHTTKYTLDVWSQWCGIFKPFGWLLAVLFSRRLQQLNMPISSLDTSAGITSDIIKLRDESGVVGDRLAAKNNRDEIRYLRRPLLYLQAAELSRSLREGRLPSAERKCHRYSEAGTTGGRIF